MKVIVYHRGYGCDTGCCGHSVQIDGKGDDFHFAHPYGEDLRAFAEELVRTSLGEEHVKDLDWENCVIEENC